MATRVGTVTMALDIESPANSKRPIGFVIAGVVLIVFAGYLLYELEKQKSGNIYVPSSYEYTVRQSVNTEVTYLDSSFYKNGPGPTNTAYVKDLTDKIKASFYYQFTAEDVMKATYTYDVKARVLGKYAINADSEKTANVWSKEYQLVAPVTKSVHAKSITLTPFAEMPYGEYKSQIENFKTSLSLPLNSEAVMEATINIKGDINGKPFNDTRVVKIAAPLDQQLYTLDVKYDKEDKKQARGEIIKNEREQFQRYLLIFAVVVGVMGVGMVLYGLRKQIFKTPYQRELEKIYRYNDGIIIRAKRSPDLTGKRVVPVLSFEDMLNLEEELKLPIVASPAGGEATQFMIIRDDVAYVYTLGKALIEESEIGDLDTEFEDKKPHHRKAK